MQGMPWESAPCRDARDPCAELALSAAPSFFGHRATVEFKIKYSEPREDNSTGGTMVAVLDGYNAPVSAGARAGVDLLLLGARAAAARPLLPRSTGPPCFTPPQVTCWTSSSASFTTAWRSSALTGLWCRLAARRTA